MPMVVWLRTSALQAQKRAMQAIQQANSYLLAMAVTPPLVEIELNHVTHAVLEATNFLGVNAVPIGVNEFDYFVRMWTQAAVAMHGYQLETAANTVFEPIPPLKPMVVPGVGEATLGMSTGRIAATLPGSVMREMAFGHVTAQAAVESAGLHAGRAAAQANFSAVAAQSQSRKAENAAEQTNGEPEQLMQGVQQGAQIGMQLGSQLGSMAMQAPQQMMQTVAQPMQQLVAPMQQVSSMFGQMGSGGVNNGAQFGLMGASPFSNHPLAGGTGPATGAGLVRAASLPGAGGTLASTPLMNSLIAQPTAGAAVPTGAAAGGAGAGLAPVGAGAGGGPMGGMGSAGKRGGNRQSLATPSQLAHDRGEDEDEDDDW
jgi:PPE-repeat protein